MTSARIAGLAVALGLGYAAVTGIGVASADESGDSASSADSSSSSETAAPSSSASHTGEGSAGSTAASSKRLATPAGDPEASAEAVVGDSDSADGGLSEDVANLVDLADGNAAVAEGDMDFDEPEEVADILSATALGDDAADEPEQEADAWAPSFSGVASSTVIDSAEPEPSLQHAVDAIGIAAPAPSEEAIHPTGEAPVEPFAAPAIWTLAAATRRDLDDENLYPAQSASPVTGMPSVIAFDHEAPLAFLQRLPILGPILVTPIVALLHQIPILSDVLHPWVGYPVRWGAAADGPIARDVRVVSADGTEISVHFMPAHNLETNQQAPTVLNGPGLGAPGATNVDGTFLDSLLADFVGIIGVGTLRRAGYNVVTWDPRGEWYSGGILELNAAEFEGRDMSAIISWIATQPEVMLDGPGDPRMGMVGVSYGGGIQLVTAANDSRVDAIVPAITYNRLDTSLYKNEAFKSSWATPLTALLTVLGGRINPRILPATLYGDVTGRMLPDDLELFRQRNPAVEDITVPTLLIAGTVDTIFSLAEADATARTLLANGVTTKVVWFCGGHGVCLNNLFDLSDGRLIEQRTLAWLNRFVKQDPTVDTGPAFEWVDQRGRWFSARQYPVAAEQPVVETLTAARTLPLIPFLAGSGLPFVPYSLPAINSVDLVIAPRPTTTYLLGAPVLSLTYSGNGSARHVYAQLVDNTTGLVLGSIATPVPVTLDGNTHTATVDLEPVAHTLQPGESVTLQLVSSAGLYERLVPSVGMMRVSSMQLALPVAVVLSAEVLSPPQWRSAPKRTSSCPRAVRAERATGIEPA